MRLMVFRTAGVKRVLKVEIIRVTAVNQRKDAAVTPVMKGADSAGGRAARKAPSIMVPSIMAWGLNQVTTQAEEMVLHFTTWENPASGMCQRIRRGFLGLWF